MKKRVKMNGKYELVYLEMAPFYESSFETLEAFLSPVNGRVGKYSPYLLKNRQALRDFFDKRFGGNAVIIEDLSSPNPRSLADS